MGNAPGVPGFMSTEQQQTLSPEIEPPPPTLGERIRRVLAVPARLLGALFIPDRMMPRVVGEERSTAAFLAVVLFALGAAFVVGQRVDVSRQVLMQEDMNRQMMGPDAPMRSDRELIEEIGKQRTIEQVKLGLSAGLATPAWIFGLSLAVLLIGRYVGGRPTMGRAVAAAANASLPAAVKSGLVMAMAWPSAVLTPKAIDEINRVAVIPPLGDGFLRFASVDAFMLWSVLLLGFALAAAAGMSRRRSFITVLVCFAMFQLLTGGAAGPAAGPGPGPMMPPGGGR